MTTSFHFHGDLPSLLRGKLKNTAVVSITLDRRASIKDVLESFGLPHTEIGRMYCEGREMDFTEIAKEGIDYTVEPLTAPWNVFQPTLLRPDPLPAISFIADVNVGRLARYLRAGGFDTLYNHRWRDGYIAGLLNREKRVLLTRDMGLLMRRQVEFGRYIRATQPIDQFREVVDLFGLTGRLSYFTRCLECNGLLEPVAKEEILHRLEPLTRKYYHSFSRCTSCDRIYWHGSHAERMEKLFAGR